MSGTATDGSSGGNWTDYDGGVFGGVAVVSLPTPLDIATITGGHPTALGVDAIAVDGTNLYWTDYDDGWVMSCSKSACTLPTLLIGGQANPYGIAIDKTNIYWTNLGGQVMQCPIAGCGDHATVLASGQNMPTFITVDATDVYWTNSGTTGCVRVNNCPPMPVMSGSGGQVVKCAIGGCGGAPTVLAADASDPTGIAVDAANVYWTDFLSGQVMECAVGGCSGQPTVLASGQSAPYAIAVDGASVYWTNWGADWATGFSDPVTLMACAKGGCGNAPTTLSTGKSPAGYGLAVDGAAVYWTDDAQLMKVQVTPAPGATTVLASGYGPEFIALDATNVYWYVSASFIMKAPK
jgi:hypothetical protein